MLARGSLPEGALKTLIAEWPGDPSTRGDVLPLRLAGALHRLVIDGKVPDLAACYPPQATEFDAVCLAPALKVAISAHESFLCDYLKLPPQTNEVRRSSMVMAGLLEISNAVGKPLSLLEIGSSAGFNLYPDLYRHEMGGLVAGDPASPLVLAPEWHGSQPRATTVTIAERRGCDRNPLDPTRAEDVVRLKSYTWPDQLDRMTRLETALALVGNAALHIAQADALDWLSDELARPAPQRCRVVYHSIVLQYLVPADRERFAEIMVAAGARANEDSPLAWLSIEADGRSPGCAVTLTAWPDGTRRTLARADFHGRWIRWGEA
ncbi:hypothetical protein C8N35_11289 [Breoghania corrubedonensis]|uniref:DUF2332 domain-containing protein n=2 Tax=Breoghania corrubedonensis TaxID=665038 RepID=A0A2T5UW82_9HYPH|nr:hypothetical protein C8N35_11289 [Breoghania corrubedonensis]